MGSQDSFRLAGAVDLIDWLVSGKLDSYAVRTLGLDQEEEAKLPQDIMATDSQSGWGDE